jgi:GAF domain-containing protein
MPECPTPALDDGREALRRFLVGEDDLTSMLTKVALLSADAIPGTDMTSITMLLRDEPHTPAYTDKRALELDQVQYALGDGPCLSALRHQGVEQVATATDDRWPTFSSEAQNRGVTSVLSAPLTDGETAKGALNLYSQSGFDEDAPALACLFADQLGLAAANVALFAEGATMADHLRSAMESRATIEQAKGILMGAQRCGPEQAFDILRRASQGQNRKLRDIATEIVDRYAAGESPES